LSEDRAKSCYLPCFGNNVSNIIYYDIAKPYSWFHAHHVIINDVNTFNILQNTMTTNCIQDVSKRITSEQVIDYSNLVTLTSLLFPSNDIETFQFEIPAQGDIGLEIKDDLILNLPYLEFFSWEYADRYYS
jgi:hypothetical protein